MNVGIRMYILLSMYELLRTLYICCVQCIINVYNGLVIHINTGYTGYTHVFIKCIIYIEYITGYKRLLLLLLLFYVGGVLSSHPGT